MPILSSEFILNLDGSGPRYISYPSADRFVVAFTEVQLRQALAQRKSGARAVAFALSVAVYIPFCESLCHYCACNQVVARRHEHCATYLRYLGREIDLYTAQIGVGQALGELHLGGGTPTFLSDDELRELMRMLRNSFNFLPDGEYGIEVDPRTVNPARLATLAELGFNRLSFGIQDFDPAVQNAVHRVQSLDNVLALLAAARALPFKSINIDLIYGLPLQTLESFERTIAQVVALRPERISLYGYAHFPEHFKPQRSINVADLPTDSAKLLMLKRSLATLEAAGYVHVGMGHLALPSDALAVAWRQGRLHRNFQGYSPQPDCDLIGLGVSAIGKVGATYSQNATTLESYYDQLDQGRLPVERGLLLSRDDLLRRSVIMALMCQGRVDFESIELAHLIDFADYFVAELQTLQDLQEQGLLEVSSSGIQVSARGQICVCGVAMVFDRYVQADRTLARVSRII
ncbi:coproporphyrinogen-III oxidase [Polaromonas sp.]|nr:coproporphyrinogen-III oxidase [Polaromonas sp.]